MEILQGRNIVGGNFDGGNMWVEILPVEECVGTDKEASPTKPAVFIVISISG